MNGIINFLKPPGMSSNGAVGFFKKTLDFKKIGHAGTLDPGACGVLVILVGKATKLSDYLMNSKKEYIGEITFGASTNTQDSYGEVLNRDSKIISKEMIKNVLPEFIGEINQTPSKFSAIRVGGRKAYELARKGKDFKLKSRKVMIFELDLLKAQKKNSFLLKIKCSKGTYIRALFEDIGKSLDTYAYLSFLERSKSGEFNIKNAITIDEAAKTAQSDETEKMLISMDSVLKEFSKVVVYDNAYKRIRNGLDGTIKSVEENIGNEKYRVYCNGEFFGLGKIENDRVKLTNFLLGE